MFILPYPKQNEEGDPGDGGYSTDGADGADGANSEGAESGAGGEEVSYLFGDVTSDEASERFGYLRELPDQLRNIESRVADSISPVMETMKQFQEKLGSQPAFDPKLERFSQALTEYDPNLAKTVLPALIEDLKSSLSYTPLGAEMLQPLIDPMLQQQNSTIVEQIVPTLIESLPFDADGIVKRDGEGNVAAPETELQKDFTKWWDQTDAPTRKALGIVGLPYVQALQQFGKWRAGQIKRKGQAAGAASARLSSASPPINGGRRTNPPKGLQTESDGFNSVFAKRR